MINRKHLKHQRTSDRFVTHFDSNLKLILACDASAYGVSAVLAHHCVGAVLAHQKADGTEKPIGYASRTLSKAERSWKKKVSPVSSGSKSFMTMYLDTRLSLTDHKPLLGLFKEDKGTSQQASLLVLNIGHSYCQSMNTHRTTTKHANADDTLSRLPLPVVPKPSNVPPELVNI